MSKTITIIELLNKIANGEEIPKKIKVNNRIYKFCKDCKVYEDENECDLALRISKYMLNDTVEILEDEEQIDIDNIDELRTWRSTDNGYANSNFESFYEKINELVKAVKQINKKLEEK